MVQVMGQVAAVTITQLRRTHTILQILQGIITVQIARPIQVPRVIIQRRVEAAMQILRRVPAIMDLLVDITIIQRIRTSPMEPAIAPQIPITQRTIPVEIPTPVHLHLEAQVIALTNTIRRQITRVAAIMEVRIHTTHRIQNITPVLVEIP